MGVSPAASYPVTESQGQLNMDHEYSKLHPRSMSALAMAAIRVRQSRRWVTWDQSLSPP